MLVLQEGQHERAGGERSVSVWMAITKLSAKQEVDEKVSVQMHRHCGGKNEVGAHVTEHIHSTHQSLIHWTACMTLACRQYWQK